MNKQGNPSNDDYIFIQCACISRQDVIITKNIPLEVFTWNQSWRFEHNESQRNKTEIIHTQAKKYIWYPTASMSEYSFFKQIRWFVLSPDSKHQVLFPFFFFFLISAFLRVSEGCVWRQLRAQSEDVARVLSFPLLMLPSKPRRFYCLYLSQAPSPWNIKWKNESHSHPHSAVNALDVVLNVASRWRYRLKDW